MTKGTKQRSIRIDDDLWNKAQEIAAMNGDNLSFIIRDRLREYVEDHQEEQ
jgi:predicted transcriptional regulator